MRWHDLIVVGAGPVGCAVAIHAQRAGMDVVVVERRDGVQDKACGEGLMPGALRSLQALGVNPSGAALNGITYRQGDTAVTSRFRSGPGRGVRRTELSAAVHQAVDAAGIERVQADAADGFVMRPGDAQVAGRCARWVVAADGLHSPLRRMVGGDPDIAPRRRRVVRPAPRYGLRRHYRLTPWTDTVEVTWAADTEAYVTPVGRDTVGVAVLGPRRAGFDEQLTAFPALSARLHDAAIVSRDRGAGPLRQDVRRRTLGRVLLAGDAAGYVDALTGEGLAVGLAGAPELVACLVAGRPEEWETTWRRTTRTSRALTLGLLWARQHPALGHRVVPAAHAAPWLFGRVVDRLAV